MVCPWCCNKTYFSEVNSYVKKVTTVFKLNADDTNANYMRAYMKSNADFLGIKTPLREELSKPFLLKDKLLSSLDTHHHGSKDCENCLVNRIISASVLLASV